MKQVSPKTSPETDRRAALRLARRIGCTGAHQRQDGVWLPCESAEELQKISNSAETRLPDGAKGDDPPPCIGCGQERRSLRRRQGDQYRQRWQRFREQGVAGIDTLPDGGLVSAPVKDDDPDAVKRFDYFARDGDLDGQVQDGTDQQRRSRTLSHAAIGRGRKKPASSRVRLRDLPFPYPTTPTPDVES